MTWKSKQKAGRKSKEESICSWTKINKCLFPTLPEHYPLKKKLLLARSTTNTGAFWDLLQIVLSLFGCLIYVYETYQSSYADVQFYFICEVVITQFFLLDFIFSCVVATSWRKQLSSFLVWVDIAIILPVYWNIISRGASHIALQFLRVLRLARVLRTLRVIAVFNGIQRQVVQLVITLLCLVFIASGVIHFMENDTKQEMHLDCQYIGDATNYEPSCSAQQPAYELVDCDCHANSCEAAYSYFDIQNEPALVKCHMMPFFQAFYFIVVTVSTVGYGDFSPTTELSMLVVIVFILSSVVLIPMQVNQLVVLLQAGSAYRNNYIPRDDEDHVILCGYVNDRAKIEPFLKEFFHPDRAFLQDSDYHVVLLSPLDPTDEMVRLINGPAFETRVTYLIGSALSMEDLKRVRADVACAMFFLCNTEVSDSNASLDDSATVLRTLSVSNYNPNLECLVQVLKPEDRDILRDSDVDVILCMDEFKTSLQARNAVCPGYATLIENLFHTFGNISVSGVQNTKNGNWSQEYLHGVDMEIYYIPLDRLYMESLSYEWTLMCEGIYLEYDVMLIGVCCGADHSICLNPSPQEMQKFAYPSKFFSKYNVGILIADEQILANAIAAGMADLHTVNRIVEKLVMAEQNFACRKKNVSEDLVIPIPPPAPHIGGKIAPRPSMMNSLHNGFNRVSRMVRTGGGAPVIPNADGSPNTRLTGVVGRESLVDKPITIKDLVRAVKSRGTVLTNHLDSLNKKPKKVKKRMERNSPGRASPVAMTPSSMAKKSSRKNMVIYEDDEDEDEDGTGAKAAASPGIGKLGHNPSQIMDNTAEDSDEYSSSSYTSSSGSSISGFDSDSSSASSDMTDESAETKHAEVICAVGTRRSLYDEDGHVLENGEIIGNTSIRNHVVVFGSAENLPIFVQELRRPLMVGSAFHPIVVVGETEPKKWERMRESFADLYFIRGKITKSIDFNRMNIKNAHAVVQLASRDSVTTIEGEHLDSSTLFSYLKLEKYIPRNVFFSVELTCITNVAVLNSTIMRRSKASLQSGDTSAAHYGLMEDNCDLGRSRTASTGTGTAPPSAKEAKKAQAKIENARMIRQLVVAGGRAKRGTFASTKASAGRSMTAKTASSAVSASTALSNRKSLVGTKVAESLEINVRMSQRKSKNSMLMKAVAVVIPNFGRPSSYNSTASSTDLVVRSSRKTRKTSFLHNLGHGAFFGSLNSKVNSVSDLDTDSGDSEPRRFKNNRPVHRRFHHAASGSDAEYEDEYSGDESGFGDSEAEQDVLDDPNSSGNVNSGSFWGTSDSHHTLPVFASGRAFVPTTFDSILCQSFFGVLTPILTEKLICGQRHQTVYQIPLPAIFEGRYFVDCFRSFLSRNVSVGLSSADIIQFI